MSAVEDERSSVHVGKAELCALLGWSRDRLDRRLIADASFPIEARGGKGVAWSFDVAKVKAYVAAESEQQSSAPLTPRARRELAQAQQIEDELRRSRAEVVETAPLNNALQGTFALWARYDDSASDTIAQRLGLDENESRIVREILDDRRRLLVDGLSAYLDDE